MYLDIKNSYYGGRTEIFKPHITNAFYYDVNSLYPSACLSPMPGLDASYVEYLNISPNISDLFGFFYVRVTAPKNISESFLNYIGLLPYRDAKGNLSFPLGTWEGWYFTEECKLAQEFGYEIKVIKGYKFNKIESPFIPYINKLNSIKATTKNPAERQIAKLLMNSSLGRFGRTPYKNICNILTFKDYNLISATREVYNSIEIEEDLFIVTYSSTISKEKCTKNNIDYLKVKTSQNAKEKNTKYNDFSSISTASAVLYARIFMAKALIYILKNGGNIIYMDTDSIVCDIKLPDYLVSHNELGKFKLEHEIVEAYFLSEKFYALKTTDLDEKGNNIIVIKTKGLPKGSITWDQRVILYKTGKPFISTKVSSQKNKKEGSVKIDENPIKLNLLYKKRNKVINNNNWVDTTPLIINGITKDLIYWDKPNLGLNRSVDYRLLYSIIENTILSLCHQKSLTIWGFATNNKNTDLVISVIYLGPYYFHNCIDVVIVDNILDIHFVLRNLLINFNLELLTWLGVITKVADFDYYYDLYIKSKTMYITPDDICINHTEYINWVYSIFYYSIRYKFINRLEYLKLEHIKKIKADT